MYTRGQFYLKFARPCVACVAHGARTATYQERPHTRHAPRAPSRAALIIKGVRGSKSKNQKEKIKKKKPTQHSNTPTVAVAAAQTTPHSITPKPTHHTRRDGARRGTQGQNDPVAQSTSKSPTTSTADLSEKGLFLFCFSSLEPQVIGRKDTPNFLLALEWGNWAKKSAAGGLQHSFSTSRWLAACIIRLTNPSGARG